MLDLLRSRRSIRKYKSQPIPADKVEALCEAVLRSPSSRGLNPWEFVFVQDKFLLEQLSRAKAHGSEFVKDAALAIVVCADEAQCDVWIEDCSIASVIAHLAAHSLGLGSCWVQIRLRTAADGQSSEAVVRRTLSIPDSIRVLSIVAIGLPGQTLKPIPAEKLPTQKIHSDNW